MTDGGTTAPAADGEGRRSGIENRADARDFVRSEIERRDREDEHQQRRSRPDQPPEARLAEPDAGELRGL